MGVRLSLKPLAVSLFAMTCGSLVTGQASAKVSVTKTGESTVYRVSIDDFVVTETKLGGDIFKTVELKGVEGYEGIAYEPGTPELPVVRFFADGDVSVSVTSASKVATEKANLQFKPAQPSRVKLPSEKNEAVVITSDAYKSRSPQPSQPFTIEKAGQVRGVTRFLVTLYPVRYIGETGALVLQSDFEVSIKDQEEPRRDGPDTFAFIVGSAFEQSPALAEYEAYKRQQGFKTLRMPVSSATSPEEIRGWLQTQFANSNLKFALIIGDAEDVQGKTSTIISGITDHYYRAIDTDNYEEDINGPDIGVGRVSVRTEEQLAAVLTKYTRYTEGQFSSETWLNGVSFLATNDRYQVAEGTHNYAIDTYTAPSGYMGVFPEAEQVGGDKLYAITHRVTDARANEVMRLGRTIIDYSGHGATTFWDSPRMTQDDVRALTDLDAMPFVISNACITGNFRTAESFGETWQRHGAGAIMFWGSMDNTYWDEDDILERRMFDGIYREQKLRFDEITHFALSEHWRHYGGAGKSAYYWESYVTFGDPSIELRTSYVADTALEGPEVVPVGVGQVTYAVLGANGTPVKGARVALTLAETDFAVAGKTDANGQVTFDISGAAQGPATFAVSVTGPNLARKVAELKVVPSDSPFLAFSEFHFNGRDVAKVYVGETVVLQFLVTNFGRLPTSGATIHMEATGPAEVVSDTAGVPALAGRGVHELNSDNLRLVVAPSAASGDLIKIKLRWQTDEGQESESTVTASVLKAGLELTTVDFGDANGEGGIAPGDRGPLYLTIKNVGTEPVASGTLTIQPGRCVTEVSEPLIVQNLLPGEMRRLAEPLTVTTDGMCANGDTAEIGATLAYQSQAMAIELVDQGSFTVGVVSIQSESASEINLQIPDMSEAVSFDLPFAHVGILKDIGIGIDLTHTYVGDLTVSLVHPDGTEVTLHNREGSSMDDINVIYGMDGTAVPALLSLSGKPTNGTWKVKIQDHASSDIGTLNAVTLKVKAYFN